MIFPPDGVEVPAVASIPTLRASGCAELKQPCSAFRDEGLGRERVRSRRVPIDEFLMKSSGYAVFSLVACGIPAGAMAQGANEELRSGNEAIVVTATRQPLFIERVPGSVLLIDEPALEQAEGATGAEDLAELLPGVEAAVANGTQVAFQIRGIGAVDHQALTPTAAAVYADGVFQATNVQTSALLYDLERVEVLKGPQGPMPRARITRA